MDSQVKAAHIQGRYGFVTAVVVAIITGIFSIFSAGYIDKLLDDIDVLNSENDSLSSKVIELEQQLNDTKYSYSDLQECYHNLEIENTQWNEKYDELDAKYKKLLSETGNADLSSVPEKTIKQEKWIDLLDVFYHEGKHISGSTSDGWYKIWDSSLQKDSLGNEHNHGIYVRGFRDDTYILEYILDDTYIGFKGLFTLEYESRNTQVESNLKVYSIDDNDEKELLYSTPQSLHGGIKPIPFDFLIYDADHIRIEISSASGDRGEFLLALVDACFYK